MWCWPSEATEWLATLLPQNRLWFQPMTTLKRFVTFGSVSVLVLFGFYVVSTPFLRESPVPVVNVTIEPQPLPETNEPSSGNDDGNEKPSSETTEDAGVTTSPAYQTGERTGEKLNHLWQQTKEFGTGLWSGLTTKEQ